jgi:hypothetical protein
MPVKLTNIIKLVGRPIAVKVCLWVNIFIQFAADAAVCAAD